MNKLFFIAVVVFFVSCANPNDPSKGPLKIVSQNEGVKIESISPWKLSIVGSKNLTLTGSGNFQTNNFVDILSVKVTKLDTTLNPVTVYLVRENLYEDGSKDETRVLSGMDDYPSCVVSLEKP